MNMNKWVRCCIDVNPPGLRSPLRLVGGVRHINDTDPNFWTAAIKATFSGYPFSLCLQ
jgi:hypothetical protein